MTGIDATGLTVSAGNKVLVRNVDLALGPGQILVILGETGSGKTLLAEMIMGTLPPELSSSGRIVVDGVDVTRLDPAARRALWGRRIAMLPQEPWAALDPTMRALGQVEEVYALVRGDSWAQARGKARHQMARLGLETSSSRYPFQLSGGMNQRVAIAATHATAAPVVIADEPTKGLDSVLRDEVAAMLLAEAAGGTAVLVITHDIALARRLSGDVMVMLEGDVVERGTTDEVLRRPQHDYTRLLLASDPSTWQPTAVPARFDRVVEARNLAKSFDGRKVVAGVDVEVGSGEIVAVTGPSGCGKTTLGNLVLGLLDADRGTVHRKPGVPRHRFQKIYQDPVAAFPPQARLGTVLTDVAHRHGVNAGRLAALLPRLGVAFNLLERRPDQVSGGELQRIALARTLLVDPVLLFADEATSRLDPVTQKQVMDLLREIVAERGMAMLLVTHDRDLARGMAHRQVDLNPATTTAH